MSNQDLVVTTETLSHFKTKQDLENEQKFQKKSDSTDLKGAVRYDAAQVLTDEQKAQARANIGIDLSNLGSGGTVVAEDEIDVVTATMDLETGAITIPQATADAINNYIGEKPMYIKVEPVNIYGLYEGFKKFSGYYDKNLYRFTVDTDNVTVSMEQIVTPTILNEEHTTPHYSDSDVFSANYIHNKLATVVRVDENYKIPSHYLPSYVDDVVEGYYITEGWATGRFCRDPEPPEPEGGTVNVTNRIEGEIGKIYFDLNTGNIYRWGGSQFVRINPDEYRIATNADIDALFS